MSSAAQLDQGLDALGITLTPQQREKLIAYLVLLAKWNAIHNLTAVREESKMVSHHVLDSLTVLPQLESHMKRGRLLDVGSGGGLPGIPLAIARAEMPVTLLDSNQKKSAFLKQAVIELQLPNVVVVNQRVEDYAPAQLFATIISRAFADLGEFVTAAKHLLAPGGLFAAMKGLHPHEEIAQLPAGFRLQHTVRLTVPGVIAERHLLLIGADSAPAA
jgi:16S rRNA (guanine527-N7)-methyltransferase